MLRGYAQILRIPGARAFIVAGFVGRLPFAMIPLAIVLYVSATTGSYATAGLLSATEAIAAAFGSPATSRIIDRLGQSRVLPWLAAGQAISLVAFVLAVSTGQSLPVLLILAGLAGACQPSVGSCVRARWVHVTDPADPTQLRRGFAFDSILEEVVFTVSPMLTAIIAVQVSLPLPLILAAVFGVTGSGALAALRRTAPGLRRHDHRTGRRRPAVLLPGMTLLAVCAMGLGGVFGTFEVTTVAFTQQQGFPEGGGFLLALWAVFSMLGGLWFGARTLTMSGQRVLLVQTCLLTGALVPAALSQNLVVIVLVTVLSGSIVAPTLISVFTLTERLVPASALTEGLAWAVSGITVGFALGSALAGQVVDQFSTSAGYALPTASAALACLTALAGGRYLGRHLAPLGQHAAVGPTTVHDPPLPDPMPGPGPSFQPLGEPRKPGGQ
jgi:MFS family permease